MNTKRNIFIAFILNLLFSIFEVFGGVLTGSIAILSDAVHDFGDAISIGASYFLEKISNKKPDKNYTYGYARFSVLGGLVTTVILLVSSGIVIYNAVLRMINPVAIDYGGMLVFAGVGLAVNIVATYVTHGGESVNQKAVNLHMLEDVLGWLVVLVGAGVMRFTGWYLIDPVLSIAVAVFVVLHCVRNLGEIADIFLIKTPKNIDIDGLITHLKEIDGVADVHHLHVWTIDGQAHCASVHIVANQAPDAVKARVKTEMREHGIAHATVESCNEACDEITCAIKTETLRHGHSHHTTC